MNSKSILKNIFKSSNNNIEIKFDDKFSENIPLSKKNKVSLKFSDKINDNMPFIQRNQISINFTDIVSPDKNLSKTKKVIIDFNDKINIMEGIIEIDTIEKMENATKEQNIGKIYRFVGETNEKYVNGALYLIEEE